MTTVSKNVYFVYYASDDNVDEYNKKYLRTIKMKPIDVKSNSYAECNFIECNVDSNKKDSKSVIVQEFQKINTFIKRYIH